MVFDTTLRRSHGLISLGVSQQLEVAAQLTRLGADVIEVGSPGASRTAFETVQTLARGISGAAVCVVTGLDCSQIDVAWEAVQPAEKPRIHLVLAAPELGSSAEYGTPGRDALGRIHTAVAQAKRRTEDIEFSVTPLFALHDLDSHARVIQAAIAGGATTISVSDVIGDAQYLLGEEYAALVRRLYALVPSLRDVILSTECSNALGLGTANTLVALKAGCRQVKCAMHGAGAATPLEQIARVLSTGKLRGLWSRIKDDELPRTSALVSISKMEDVPATTPIVGRNTLIPRPLALPEEQSARLSTERDHLDALGQPIPGWMDELC